MRRFVRVPLLALMTCSGLALAGPIGDYYLTGCLNSGDCTNTAVIFRIHGNTVTQTDAHNQGSGEYGIAINDNRIKTVSYYSLEPGPPHEYGAGYDFGGTYIPSSQYWFNMDFDNGRSMLDGTTDGTRNYGINYDYSELWQFGQDWGSGSAKWSLVSSFGGYKLGGSAFDRRPGYENQIWIAANAAGVIFDSQLGHNVGNIQRRNLSTGSLIGSFVVPFANGGLAVDDDGSIWIANNTNRGWVYHYSALGSEIVADRIQLCPAGCSNLALNGGEIANASDVAAWVQQQNAIPEPGTSSLLVIAAGAALLLRRRYLVH